MDMCRNLAFLRDPSSLFDRSASGHDDGWVISHSARRASFGFMVVASCGYVSDIQAPPPDKPPAIRIQGIRAEP